MNPIIKHLGDPVFEVMDDSLIRFSCMFFVPAAISDYRQSLQFQNLNEEKRNIQIEVCLHGLIIYHMHLDVLFSVSFYI